MAAIELTGIPRLANENGTVPVVIAVKDFRAATGLGLKESKGFIDRVRDRKFPVLLRPADLSPSATNDDLERVFMELRNSCIDVEWVYDYADGAEKPTTVAYEAALLAVLTLATQADEIVPERPLNGALRQLRAISSVHSGQEFKSAVTLLEDVLNKMAAPA